MPLMVRTSIERFKGDLLTTARTQGLDTPSWSARAMKNRAIPTQINELSSINDVGYPARLSAAA